MTSKVCNHCHQQFANRRDLVNHHLRERHSDVILVCPWCEQRNKEFRWAQDLRRHARQHHRDEHDSMSGKLLSTGNCFYFCRNPQQYQNLFDINKTSTKESNEARQLMARWCNTHNENLKKWQDGWSLVTSATLLAPQKQSTHTDSHNTEQSTSRKRTLEDMYTLQHIIITPDNIKCYLKNEESFFLIRLSKDTFNDTKAMNTLTRKMLTLGQNFQPPTDTWKFTQNITETEDISALFGVQSHFITTIFTQPSQPFKLVKTNQVSSPLVATEAEETQANIPSQTHNITTPNNTHQTMLSETDGESLRSPSPISLVGEESPSYNPNSPSYEATPLSLLSPLNTQSPSPKYNTYSPQYINKTEQVTEPTATKDTSLHYSPTPVNSSKPTYIPTPKHNTIQKHAHDLLAVGSHPLLPAARRDWSAVSDESIDLTPTLKWPPKNWSLLTADQRTLASEYAAMSIHNTTHNSLQITDRTQLLHRYNFLVLPGCKGTTQTTLTKAQYHNYQLVRSIATGNSTLPREEQQEIVTIFQKNQPSQLQQTLAHIPLRLTK